MFFAEARPAMFFAEARPAMFFADARPAMFLADARPAMLLADARAETALEAVETAGLLPKLSTRISGRSLPVASLIFAFWASVSLIFTSFAMVFCPPLLPFSKGKNVASGDRAARL